MTIHSNPSPFAGTTVRIKKVAPPAGAWIETKDDEVLYGKVSPYGHLVHISEIESGENE